MAKKTEVATTPTLSPHTHLNTFSDVHPHTHSSCRKSLTVRSREIISLATILKPNSLMLA